MRQVTLAELLRLPPWTPGVEASLRRTVADPRFAAVSVQLKSGDYRAPQAIGWHAVPAPWPDGTIYAWIRSDADPDPDDVPLRTAPQAPARCKCCDQVLRSPSPSTTCA